MQIHFAVSIALTWIKIENEIVTVCNRLDVENDFAICWREFCGILHFTFRTQQQYSNRFEMLENWKGTRLIDAYKRRNVLVIFLRKIWIPFEFWVALPF